MANLTLTLTLRKSPGLKKIKKISQEENCVAHNGLTPAIPKPEERYVA